MLPLLIQVSNKETGAQIEAGFKRSPVRIGRNHLNDLAIDEGFVSQWHGLVRFDEETTSFLDLGSTNGTRLNGERLEKNIEIDLEPETRLAVGPLRLTFTRVALRDDQILSRRASAFQLGGTRRAAKGFGAGGTVELGGPSGDPTSGAATIDDTDVVHKKQQLVDMAKRQKALIDTLKPLYAAHLESEQQLQSAIEAGLADAPADQRATQTSLLQQQFPKAFGGMGGGEGSGDADVPEWLERLAPGSSGEWGNPFMAMERAGAVMEGFAQALIDLEEGQKQIRGELNIEGGPESNSLPAFQDSRELLAYLLDGAVDGRERLDELSRTFADLALHQLGIVNGAIDGARAILSALSPHALGTVARGALVKTSFGFGDYLWPFTAAGGYYRYAAKHLDISTQDRFTAQLFGTSFARAYNRITGRRS